jgi:hypothetical protein
MDPRAPGAGRPRCDALQGIETHIGRRAKYGEWLILGSAIMSEQSNPPRWWSSGPSNIGGTDSLLSLSGRSWDHPHFQQLQPEVL